MTWFSHNLIFKWQWTMKTVTMPLKSGKKEQPNRNAVHCERLFIHKPIQWASFIIFFVRSQSELRIRAEPFLSLARLLTRSRESRLQSLSEALNPFNHRVCKAFCLQIISIENYCVSVPLVETLFLCSCCCCCFFLAAFKGLCCGSNSVARNSNSLAENSLIRVRCFFLFFKMRFGHYYLWQSMA